MTSRPLWLQTTHGQGAIAGLWRRSQATRVIWGTMLGPVSSAAHSAPTVGGALFSIGIGLVPLIYAWMRFFRTDDEHLRPSVKNMLGISLISCVPIAIGIWEWIRALKV